MDDMLVSWNDHFALGIDAIDAGHGLVIEAINQLNESASSADSERVAAHMLPLLRRTLGAQFEVEARLLASHPPRASTEHQAEHHRLLEAFDALADTRAAGGDIAGLLLLNLVCFLVSHLRATDGDTYAAHRFAPVAA